MKMINKIIVALDSSDSAIHATHYAIELSRVLKAQIEMVSITKYSLGNIDAGVLPQEIEKANELRTKKLIDKIKKEHSNVTIVDLEIVGIPEKEIIKEIKRWKADLLILGHHSHTFIEKLFVKSIEKKLINHIKCPILIIPEKINNKK